ncbi:hypothetical protein [Streptococcus mitis]|uniref:hypothetical protein n=1 Tax=Streptococcus mitis TaxID=28037 RepID=UPI0019119706|nr:hypothetical protein [Streptococcus mitis]QQQ34684.1 hypothetical protein JJN14_06375 [Streptococcus mitis]
MKPTNLEWEDVIQFEEVEGYGQHIWRDEDKYYFVLEEGTVVSWLVVYELPNEIFALLESGERTLREVSWKIKHDSWPPTEEERRESRRKFISKHPASLIDVPKNRKLFSKEELEELIPIAEKQWIESEGELPYDYVSPLK